MEDKTKVQTLSLAKECVINKLDLLTNATVVDDAMKFLQESKYKLKLSSSIDNHGPNYDSKKQEKYERKMEEISEQELTTTNKIF